MYIQITTKCNMSCAHCCFACEPGKGDNMNRPVFRKALKLCTEYGENVTLGGGEPTLHQHFWEFFGMAMEYSIYGSLWLATNGSLTRRTLALARIAIANPDVFSITLSQDCYHDPIDPAVPKYFQTHDLEIRDVTHTGTSISNNGAARENGIFENYDCACNSVHINPNGDLKPCGCEDAQILCNIMDKDVDDYLKAYYDASSEYGDDICGCHWRWDRDSQEFVQIEENNEEEAA